MKGLCDTCEQVSEVFQQSGRSDLICYECYVDVRITTQLYETLREVERAGGQALELEQQIKLALRRLLGRVPTSGKRDHGSIGHRLPGRFETN